MAQLEGTQTYTNLARAFAGETQAGARYQFTAKKAKAEGYTAIEQLLKTLAKNEMAHAKVFFNFLTDNATKKIDAIQIDGAYPYKTGVLCDELVFSAENEHEEAQMIYPEFAKIAAKEGFKDIALKFNQIAAIETIHQQKLAEVGEMLKAGTLYKQKTPVTWVCSECAYEAEAKAAWSICPVCGYPQGAVQLQLQ